MTDVIDLAAHREVLGTLYWSGVFKCIYCGHEHVAVAPMPAWAAAPPSGECPKCRRFGALPMTDEAASATEKLNANPDEKPWVSAVEGSGT